MTISVLDKVQKIGTVAVSCPDGNFQHELDSHGGYSPDSELAKSLVLDLASPLYSPGSKSKIYDRSGKGNHGTITGATWVRLPSGLWGLSFDGTGDNVTITSSDLDFTTSNFTFIFWINISNLTAANHLFSRGVYNASGYRILMLADGSVYIETYQAGISQATRSAVSDITTGAWCEVMIVRNGATISTFKNGVETAYQSQGTHINPVTSAANGLLGVQMDGVTEPFIGKMALVKAFRQVSVSHFNQDRQLFGV